MTDARRVELRSPIAGTVVATLQGEGARVERGAPLVVLEAMKMEHEVVAPEAGVVRASRAAVGDAVGEGELLVVLEVSAAGGGAAIPSRDERLGVAGGRVAGADDVAAAPDSGYLGPGPARSPRGIAVQQVEEASAGTAEPNDHDGSQDPSRPGFDMNVFADFEAWRSSRHAEPGPASSAASHPGDGSGFDPAVFRDFEDWRSGARPNPVVADAAPPPAIRAPDDAGARGGLAGSRADLRELRDRDDLTRDAARPEAMARRHAKGMRSARENLDDLCDAGSFVEYGALAHAAQRARRSHDDLIRRTPADGLVCGIGAVNGAAFGAERARTVVLAYDATVLAGTQGFRNHQKADRMLGLADAERLPLVLFAEGGGGRPGDVDMPVVAGLHVPTFAGFARLSGRVPLIGIAAGHCFAGNAALLGCCDTIIATRDSSIGLGGPAMVEGGGLGRHAPADIGPSDVLARAGAIDIVVADEREAVDVARRCLGLFQGPLAAFEAPDPLVLRDALPEQRQRTYDVGAVLEAVFDVGTLIELRRDFGRAVRTALARLAGRAVGILASDPVHVGGAVDADAADKASRFLQLCDAHGLPVVSFIDTPGFMVGPQSEARAHVRHASRLFVTAARLGVPLVAVVLRKAYGLGAMALAGGSLHAPRATFAWPSGEFGAMGIEGAVDLGYRKELESAGVERAALRERLVAEHYAKGRAIGAAEGLEIDAVIDPATTREVLVRTLAATKPRRSERPIDPW